MQLYNCANCGRSILCAQSDQFGNSFCCEQCHTTFYHKNPQAKDIGLTKKILVVGVIVGCVYLWQTYEEVQKAGIRQGDYIGSTNKFLLKQKWFFVNGQSINGTYKKLSNNILTIETQNDGSKTVHLDELIHESQVLAKQITEQEREQ